MASVPCIAFTKAIQLPEGSPRFTHVSSAPAVNLEKAQFYPVERSERVKRRILMLQISAALKDKRPRALNVHKIKSMSTSILEYLDDMQHQDGLLGNASACMRHFLQRWIKLVYTFGVDIKLIPGPIGDYFQTDRLLAVVEYILDNPCSTQWSALVQMCNDISWAIHDKVAALEGQLIDTARATRCLSQEPSSWFDIPAMEAAKVARLAQVATQALQELHNMPSAPVQSAKRPRE